MRVFLDQCLKCLLEALRLARLNIRESLEEHELRHQGRQRIFLTHPTIVVPNGRGVARQIAVVSLLVNRILHGIHRPDVLQVIRVGHRHGIVTLRESLNDLRLISLGQGGIALAERHQVDLEIGLQLVLVVGEPVVERLESLNGKRYVLELILINHGHVIETINYDDVRCLHVLGGERDLLQVIFPLVRIVGGDRLQALIGRPGSGIALSGSPFSAFRSLGLSVGHLIVHRLIESRELLLTAAPVVLQRTASPLALELGFTLRYRLRVIEIEGRLIATHGDRHRVDLCSRAVDTGSLRLLLGQVGLFLGQGLSLLFLLDHLLDDLVDHGQSFRLWHLGESLQTVLQVNGLDMHHQLVEHGGELRYPRIFLIFLRHAGQGVAEAGLGADIVALRKVDIAKAQGTDRLVQPVLRALLDTELVLFDGVRRVLTGHIEIAQCIIDLVEIILVLRAARHTLQHLHHLIEIAAGEYLRLPDPRGELQLVRRVGTGHPAKSLVSQRVLSLVSVDLPQKVTHPGPLTAFALGLD